MLASWGIPGDLNSGQRFPLIKYWKESAPEEAFDWPAGSGAMLAFLPTRVI